MNTLKSLLKNLIQVVVVLVIIVVFYVCVSALNLLLKIENVNKNYVEGEHIKTVNTEGDYSVINSDNFVTKFADNVETKFYENDNELIFNKQEMQDLYDDAFENTITNNMQFQSEPFLKYLSEITDYLYPNIESKATATANVLQNNLNRPITVEDFKNYVYTSVSKYITEVHNIYFDKCPLYSNIEGSQDKLLCFVYSKLKTPYSEFTKNYKKEESMGLK